jgi:hypothetical protein
VFNGSVPALDAIAMAWLWRVNLEIFLARRRLIGQDTEGWDLILRFILFGSVLSTLVLADFDDGRFHGAPASSRVMPIGYILLLAGYVGTACV